MTVTPVRMHVAVCPVQPNGYDCGRYTGVLMEQVYKGLVDSPSAQLGPPTKEACKPENRPTGTAPAPAKVIAASSQPLYVKMAAVVTHPQVVAFTVYLTAVILQAWFATQDGSKGPLPKEWATTIMRLRWYRRPPKTPTIGIPPDAELAYAPIAYFHHHPKRPPRTVMHRHTVSGWARVTAVVPHGRWVQGAVSKHELERHHAKREDKATDGYLGSVV